MEAHRLVHSPEVTLMRYSKLVYCVNLPEVERKISDRSRLGSRIPGKGSAFFGWQVMNFACGEGAGEPKLRDRRM